MAPGTSGVDLILDPIDGTCAFYRGGAQLGLIGVRDAQARSMASLDQPHLDERFEGGFGQRR